MIFKYVVDVGSGYNCLISNPRWKTNKQEIIKNGRMYKR